MRRKKGEDASGAIPVNARELHLAVRARDDLRDLLALRESLAVVPGLDGSRLLFEQLRSAGNGLAHTRR